MFPVGGPRIDPIELRQRLHALAEPSGAEAATAAFVAQHLAAAGCKVETGLGGHGVLAIIGAPPYRLLRAELDAVPARDGIGHHCGHDGHMAMLMAAMKDLAASPPRGIAALFQPAEETGFGMAACLEDPRLASLEIEDAYAIHNVPAEPLGELILRAGCKGSVGLQVTWRGKSSHAAAPWEAQSPWGELAAWATKAHAWPQREPLVSLIHARLGEEAYGTCPGEAIGAATLRAATDEALAQTWDAMLPPEVPGLEANVTEMDPFPATVNDAEKLDAIAAATQAAGIAVRREEEPFPWSEDFGYALRKWPGALVGLGSGIDQPGLHDSAYEFPDELVPIGIQIWHAIATMPSTGAPE